MATSQGRPPDRREPDNPGTVTLGSGMSTFVDSPAPAREVDGRPSREEEVALDAAEMAAMLANAPDPDGDFRRMQLSEAVNAAAPVRRSREQRRAGRVAADYGLIVTVLEDGTPRYAKGVEHAA